MTEFLYLHEMEEDDDCLRACIATIFQLEPSEVPAELRPSLFGAARTPDDVTDESAAGTRRWFEAWQGWCAFRGFALSFHALEEPLPAAKLEADGPDDLPPACRGLWIGVVRCSDGAHHAVLFDRHRLFHDPASEPQDEYVLVGLCLLRPIAEHLEAA